MLIQSGLIEREVRGVTFHFELHGYVQDYLNGLSELSFLERFCRRAAGGTYPVDSFQVSAEARTVVLALLKSDRPCHILLHGEPGTGKTEFARAVARECGKDACFVKHEAGEDQSGRRLAVQVVDRTVPPAEGVAVVDEADWLINTGRIFSSHRDPFDKGWLNLFLESSSAQFIWITNDLDFIDASVLRRFTYHVRFAGHTRRQAEPVPAHARRRMCGGPAALRTVRRVVDQRGRRRGPVHPIACRVFSARGCPGRPPACGVHRAVLGKTGNRQDRVRPPPGPAVCRSIASLRDLTLGDVTAVWKRTRSAPPGSLSHEQIVALLEKELACRTGRLRGRIGFL